MARRGRPSPKEYDLTGQTFGRLTVLERAPNIVRAGKRYPQVHAAFKVRCDCGMEKVVVGRDLRKGGTVSCGCKRRENAVAMGSHAGPEHPRWRGGRKVEPNGYVRRWYFERPDGSMSNGDSEHRLVMEQHLGRLLRPDEVVHHKNGVRHDNRLENLELWVESHPSGQRVEDQVVWATEILNRYAPHLLKEPPCRS